MFKGTLEQLSIYAEVVGMTSRDNRNSIRVEIPVETKQALKESDEAMWRLVDEALRLSLGLDEGSTEAAIEARLEDVQDERSELLEQREEIEHRLTELDEQEEDLEQKLADLREKKASHKERLFKILNEMEKDDRGRNILAWSADLKEAASHEYGSQSKDNIRRVIEDVRQLATEEGYAIAADRLSRNTASGTAAAADGGSKDLRVLGDEDD